MRADDREEDNGIEMGGPMEGGEMDGGRATGGNNPVRDDKKIKLMEKEKREEEM